MSAATALPPAPSNLPPPPSAGSTFEAPPLAVIPGDDLTRYILHHPPPINSQQSDARKHKKSRSNAGDANRNSEDEARLPPKLGTGLICIQLPTEDKNNNNINSSIRIQATVAGRLVYRQNSRTWFVASNPRRYHLSQSPAATPISSNNMSKVTSNMGVGDRVIGIVEDQKASADYYRINIFGSHSALLHVLSFEGATKRNRPQLEPGSLVYCRVIKGFAGGRMDPELSCKVGGGSGNNSGKSVYNDEEEDDGGASGKDWMTNEGTYGPLNGGTSFRVSIGLARELLLPENAVLSALDKSGIPFEIAIGVNGMVWVNSPDPEITIMILNAIKNSEVMPEDKVRGMVKVMVKNVKKELMDE